MKKRLKILALETIVLFLCCSLSVGLTQEKAKRESTERYSSPERAAHTFYNALKRDDFRAAYNSFSNELKGRVSRIRKNIGENTSLKQFFAELSQTSSNCHFLHPDANITQRIRIAGKENLTSNLVLLKICNYNPRNPDEGIWCSFVYESGEWKLNEMYGPDKDMIDINGLKKRYKNKKG